MSSLRNQLLRRVGEEEGRREFIVSGHDGARYGNYVRFSVHWRTIAKWWRHIVCAYASGFFVLFKVPHTIDRKRTNALRVDFVPDLVGLDSIMWVVGSIIRLGGSCTR